MLQGTDGDAMHETLSSANLENIPVQVAEYFASVEAGEMPAFANVNPGAAATFRNSAGESFVIAAARCGHAHIVEQFLPDADPDDTDSEGWNGLLNAAHEGHAKAARLLLEAGASVDQPDMMGWTPLMWACYKNHLSVVEELVSFKAHVNIVGEEDGLTPLIIASGRGYTDVIVHLLQNGAQVNSCDKFGSTALIWAARKGYLKIVEELLNAGAELDTVGMYSSTALMLATRGCHLKVVEAILSREPNVNVVDYNGFSALAIAAREGYTEIAQALIQAGAYVNVVDRFSNSILANAVRSGNIHLVRMLLDKHADVNAKDSDNRTPLHLAIDKSYYDIVLALLEKKPYLEIRNKDGDTALLRAVKNRDVSLCQVLVSAGAKVSATDNAGDNVLHLALRARSRRLTQVLLVNPSDSKLLYRPNKLGETPYSIDQEGQHPILPTIFGPIGADVDIKSLLGYDAYSDVLADIVCEPSLTLPLTIGLYAKWGSGKSLLLPKIRESMKSFSRSWLDGVELYWSWTIVVVLFVVCALLSLVVTAAVALAGEATLTYPVILGGSVFAVLLGVYALICYGNEIRLWNGAIATARVIARGLARFKLILSVLTLNAPIRSEKELVVSPVSFLFADDHRLSFIGGEQSLTNIVESLYTAVEEHYGSPAVRLYSAFKSTHTRGDSKLRTLCGVPVLLFAVTMLLSLLVALVLLVAYRFSLDDLSNTYNETYLVIAIVFLVFCLLAGAAPFYLVSSRLLINPPKRRLKRISHKAHSMPFERLVQKLQKEVDFLAAMVQSLDAFTNSQTRLVVMVDGLDSCEQNKMVHILDALALFFASRQDMPFIVILAVDPHIIISAIQNNLRGTAASSDLTGHDYMKNLVSMPFYLHHSAMKQLQAKLHRRGFANSSYRERKRSETIRGSRLSLRDNTLSKDNVVSTFGVGDVGNLFPSHDYFSNMNPRTMRRIVNSIALTGRLLRTFESDFSWSLLYNWISLIEQWPYRMGWLIDRAHDCQDDSMTLPDLYFQCKSQLPLKSSLVELDRNPAEFEVILKKMSSSKQDQLTVSHAKTFTPCSSNLDPYLRKLIHEQRKEEEGYYTASEDTDEKEEEITPYSILSYLGSAEYLFADSSVWTSISKPLVKMSIEEVVSLVSKLNIPRTRLDNVTSAFFTNNLNGVVLQSCDLNDLRSLLQAPLGDWTLIKLLLETLRKLKPPALRPRALSSVSMADHATDTNYPEPVAGGLNNLLSIAEEDLTTANDMAKNAEEDEVTEATDGISDEEEVDSLKSEAGSETETLLKSQR